MNEDDFFDEQSAQSECKSRIVLQYFRAWSNVLVRFVKTRDRKLAYIDLFSGPGRYEDGSPSTPLLVLDHALKYPDMREMLVAVFNDGNKEYSDRLDGEIAALSGIEGFKYRPKVQNTRVDTELEKIFLDLRLVPSFSFIDPFGYKGLTKNIIKGVIKDWGCDCVFFFNYRRINAAITNPVFETHMVALFGEARLSQMRTEIEHLSPHQREAYVLEKLAEALRELGAKYVLPFSFKDAVSKRTTHHLVFVSKNVLGYEIMKQIMANESSTLDQGVPSFGYSEADASMPLLFSLSRPLDELEGMLLQQFAGNTLTVEDIYRRHHIDRPYLNSNYKEALLNLEASSAVSADPPASLRPKRKGKLTMGDNTRISFSNKA